MRKLFNFKVGGETTPHIKGESTFFYNFFFFFFWLNYVFFTLNNVLKKPKKVVYKTINFGSTNWLNKKKKKSQEHNKCHDFLSIPLF